MAEVHRAEEEALRRWVLEADPQEPEGIFDPRARAIYRRQVRRSLIRGVRLALPITRRLLGEEAVEALIVRWLEAGGSTSRLYWQLPLEFSAWADEVAAELSHPALAELIRWETVEVDVLNAPDDGVEAAGGEAPEAGRGVALSASARLCVFTHPVHRLGLESSAWPEASGAPLFLVVWRVGERMRWREVEAPLAQLVASLSSGSPLREGLAFIEGLYPPGAVSAARLMEGLARLREAGVILGFPEV